MLVKICGITKEEEIDRLILSGADYAGFVVFYPKSKRNNDLIKVKKLIEYLKSKKLENKSNIKSVAVVVSPTIEQLDIIQSIGIDIIQIHGELSEDIIVKCKLTMWRAYNISKDDKEQTKKDIEEFFRYDNAKGIVLDGAVPGSGESFDWEMFNDYEYVGKKCILAGGLNVGNVNRAIDIVKPDVIDVSTGVEYEDKTIVGKDLEKVDLFIKSVKSHKERN